MAIPLKPIIRPDDNRPRDEKGALIPEFSMVFNSEEKPDDPVNRPKHYTYAKKEVIEVIEEFNLNFYLGNVVKYVLRCGRKRNMIQDLEKARWYLDRYISKLKGEK